MAPTTAAEAGREQEENRLQSELSSLGVDCKRKNELNGKEELEAHATAIKKVYFQDYKTAYDRSILVHHYRELKEYINQVGHMEAKVNSSKKKDLIKKEGEYYLLLNDSQ
jgi:hypothetical protein